MVMIGLAVVVHGEKFAILEVEDSGRTDRLWSLFFVFMVLRGKGCDEGVEFLRWSYEGRWGCGTGDH
jgi:aminopeptidase C